METEKKTITIISTEALEHNENLEEYLINQEEEKILYTVILACLATTIIIINTW